MAENQGPTIVTITATGPITVVVETIKDDGRERFVNGTTGMQAGEEQFFVVNGGQSLRVVNE